VKSHGLRQDEKGNLLIPLHDVDGKLWSLQVIRRDGIKSIARDSRMTGNFYAMGPLETAPAVIIAEGYATGATVREATGYPVVVAFSAGNLKPVAEALRAKYLDKALYIAADNDHEREQQGKPNVGREKAEEAARAADAHVLLPRLEKGQGTDWNDLALAAGMAEVRVQLEAALTGVQRQELVAERQQEHTTPREAATQSREPALSAQLGP
jgi:putative DNA primase/helicase